MPGFERWAPADERHDEKKVVLVALELWLDGEGSFGLRTKIVGVGGEW
jgi:hypothetical protein